MQNTVCPNKKSLRNLILAPKHRVDGQLPQLRDQVVRPRGCQGHPEPGVDQGNHWDARLRR